jgi:hypothetical protein
MSDGVTVMTGGSSGKSGGKLIRNDISKLATEYGNSYCLSGVSSLTWL